MVTKYASGEIPSAGDLISVALDNIAANAERTTRAVVLKVNPTRVVIKWCLQQGGNKRHGSPDGSYPTYWFRLVERFSARRLK